MSYYIWGALYYRMPTWDVPVSLIMGFATYLFSPWVVKSLFYLFKIRPQYWAWKALFCLAVTYACASGTYELYHVFFGIKQHPPTYWVNLYYSSLMFIAAGIFWKFEGTFRGLIETVRISFLNLPNHQRIIAAFLFIFLGLSFVWTFYVSLCIPPVQ